MSDDERYKDMLSMAVSSILGGDVMSVLSLSKIIKEDVDPLVAGKPFVGVGVERDSDTTATLILQKLDKNEKLEDAQIAWVLKRLYYLYSYMSKDRLVDGLMITFIKFLSSMPVLLSAPIDGKTSTMAFGSVFFGGETAREFARGQATSRTIGNDEETLLSIIGLHHSILKTLKNMKRDDPDRGWVELVLSDMFTTNKHMETQLKALHTAMAKTDAIRGNSVFMYLGAFIRSYDDVSPDYETTLIAYQTCIQDVYVLWTGLD
jgi:hypothetical protein